MAFDLEKLVSSVDVLSRAYTVFRDLISEASETLSDADQGALRERLIDLRAENEKGFLALDEKLAALIRKGGERA